jgi:hypothetical protein
MRTTSEPFGERVRLWCPAGTSAEDLRSARPILRAACWAADVRITQDDSRAHIVTVDVIRHRLAQPVLPGGDGAPPGPVTASPAGHGPVTPSGAGLVSL